MKTYRYSFGIVEISISCCVFYNVKFRHFQTKVLLKSTEDCIGGVPGARPVQYTETLGVALYLNAVYVSEERDIWKSVWRSIKPHL